MRRERMERLESEIKNLKELADNLGRRMENTRRKKIFETEVIGNDREKIGKEKSGIVGSTRVPKKIE